MEEIKIEEWLKNNFGYGSGSGYGYGSGYGSGYGYGYGSGSGSGFGSGDGYGYGYGYGYDSGFGSGDGYGYGYDSGIGSFGGKTVYIIDGIQTIIEYIKDSIAKGYILNSDFSLTPCFIAKGRGYFAHGESLRESQQALHEKIFENMDSTEAIEEFLKKFNKYEKYPGTEFFEWHHYLTGSCLMGRKSFVNDRGLNIDDLYTVDEFIAICEGAYGDQIIKQLKEKWNKKEN